MDDCLCFGIVVLLLLHLISVALYLHLDSMSILSCLPESSEVTRYQHPSEQVPCSSEIVKVTYFIFLYCKEVPIGTNTPPRVRQL
jgi:hypothetical protein